MPDADDALSPFAAARDPARADRVAVIAGEETLTFTELGLRVAAAVERLAALGVGRGLRVALPVATDLASVVTFLALVEARAIGVLLHPRLTPVEAETLVAASRPDLALDAAGVADIARPDRRAIVPDSLPGSDEDPLAIVFTSGTSGSPKGAILPRRAFVASALASARNLPFGPGDVWLSSLPLAHVGGLGVVTKMLVSGGAVALESKFDPDRVIDRVARGGATLFSVVPTMLDALLERDRAGVLARLRAVLLGGAPASPALLERAAHRGVLTLSTYGLTEACSQVTTQTPRDPGSVELGAGRALTGLDLAIRLENGSFSSPGDVGRIHVRGPTLMSGYDTGPSTPPNAARDAEGWFDTGDIGELDEGWHLFVHARRTDLILTGGENVYPAEVEQALERERGVRRAVVFGVADARWGQIVAAAIELETGATLDAILAGSSARLAPHKRPRLVAAVDRVALGPTGKVERRSAGERYGSLLVPVSSKRA